MSDGGWGNVKPTMEELLLMGGGDYLIKHIHVYNVIEYNLNAYPIYFVHL